MWGGGVGVRGGKEVEEDVWEKRGLGEGGWGQREEGIGRGRGKRGE